MHAIRNKITKELRVWSDNEADIATSVVEEGEERIEVPNLASADVRRLADRAAPSGKAGRIYLQDDLSIAADDPALLLLDGFYGELERILAGQADITVITAGMIRQAIAKEREVRSR